MVGDICLEGTAIDLNNVPAEFIMSARTNSALPPVPEESVADVSDGQKFAESAATIQQKPQLFDSAAMASAAVIEYPKNNLITNGDAYRVPTIQPQQQYVQPATMPSAAMPVQMLTPQPVTPQLQPVQKDQQYIPDINIGASYLNSYPANDPAPGSEPVNTSYRTAVHYAPYTTSPITESISTSSSSTNVAKGQFAVPKLPIKTAKSQRRSRSMSGPTRQLLQQPAVMPITDMNQPQVRQQLPQPVERANSLPIYGSYNRKSRTNYSSTATLQTSSDSLSTPSINVGMQQPMDANMPINSYSQQTNSLAATSFAPDQSNSLIAQLLSSATPVAAMAAASSSSTSFDAPRQFSPTAQFNFGSRVSPQQMAAEYRAMDDMTFVGQKVPMRKISSPGRICSATVSSPLHNVKPDMAMSSASSTQPTLFPANVKGLKQKSDQEKIQYKEHRRVCHINAEQKRRCNIKNGFDTLRAILPSVSQNANTKISKAAMLQKAAEYIRTLKDQRQEQQEEYDRLKHEIESLNHAIG